MKLRKPQNDYTQIPNGAITDQRIIGLPFNILCYLVSKPNNWDFHVWEIQKTLGIGKKARLTAKNKLQEAGYMRQGKHRNKDTGLYERHIQLSYEVSISPSRTYGESTYGEGVDISNTESSNTDHNNNNTSILDSQNLETSSLFNRLYTTYGLDKAYIEQAFQKKKTLFRIFEVCQFIQAFSGIVGVEPIYNKRTVNAFDIITSKLNNDQIREMLEVNRYIEKENPTDHEYETILDIIDQDYYLPEEMGLVNSGRSF